MPHLHINKAGTGPSKMLLFHGYGQDHTAFNSYIDRLGSLHTFYMIDLFFHGKSTWGKDEEALEKSEWKELIGIILKENQVDSFAVLGFSMGGKFAMATLEAFPDRVKEIILLAPDGIKTSYWYSLATYPIALRKLFRSMISDHKRFLRIASGAKRLGLIDKGVLRFVETQMDSEEKRKRVYYSWVVFRHLKFDLDSIAALINSHKIKLRLFVGRHDKIITAQNMQRLTSKVPGAQFEVVEAGHNSLIHKVIDYLPKSS
ncbi:MAG TPA: alpha/beta fold hydrolase [Cyclobacteriaceae bacterium]|nr:alpha/beta fold hydrolase [Cyclobacteriaceae bacterium]